AIPAPVVNEIPDEEIPLAAPEQVAEEPAAIPAPVVNEIPDEEIPLAAPEQVAEEPVAISASVSIASENVGGGLTPLVQNALEEEIVDAEIPLAFGASWALVNLIASLLTVLLAVIKLVSRREKEDDNKEKETRVCLSLAIPAIASVIVFILTENMRNPMAMVDRWTPVMLVLLAANCLLSLSSSFRHSRESKTDLSWKIG
ncbi:MAG: hypothetical protein Q3977_05535, partial [Oscillospiraceae bacterium]|nr:hypothetical protein [Oscillospiraceae bacterium]